MKEKSVNMVECDSDLIVMSVCAHKCCDATHDRIGWWTRALFHAT